MNRIDANGLTKIPLGRQGENLARQIVFDVSAWASEYGPGVAELIFQRNRADNPYPVALDQDGTTAIWTVNSADTQYAGDNGRCELRYYVVDTLAKSQVWATSVTPSIDTPTAEEPPEAEQGWVDQVLTAGAEAKQAAARAENAVVQAPIIGENGNWFVWDSTTGVYIDTGRYSGGSAPYIGANGNWFIGTEDSGVSATGPAGPAGRDGRDGVDGQPGRDGVDGKDGVDGEKGEPFRYEDFTEEQLEALRGPEGPAGQPGRDGIDGKDGQDGYTPRKGVDYFDGEPGQPGEKGDPFTYADFTPEQLEELRGPQGIPGKDGSDANVTAGNIESALGYTPASDDNVNQLKSDIANVQLAVSEKMDSYTIKTVMDSVATPHTQYYLGNQAAVDIVLPDTANVGQIIMVCWYNGDTAATLSITGTMLSFDYTPSANTRSEINALWDGTYWAVLENEMAVPSEVTA